MNKKIKKKKMKRRTKRRFTRVRQIEFYKGHKYKYNHLRNLKIVTEFGNWEVSDRSSKNSFSE